MYLVLNNLQWLICHKTKQFLSEKLDSALNDLKTVDMQ